MKENRDYLELAAESVKVFGNDARLDEAELRRLLDMAARDGAVDSNEERVLRNILSKVKSYELTSAMRERIRDFEKTHNIKVM